MAMFLVTTGVLNSYAAEPVSVTASEHDGNIPENTLDSSLSTRWSANGSGQYIRYDLGERFNIESIDIAFFNGDQRSAEFEVQTSDDASDWQTVFNGLQPQSTLEQQNISLISSAARFVQIVGYGNTSNSWNSIAEVDINTSDIDAPTSGF